MTVWAIADLHLSFGISDKSMDVFGPQWTDHAARVKKKWLELITVDDLVLIAGDISWAMTPEQAKADLQWIHELPGTKVLLRGNHDYWWTSISKVQKVLPPSMHLVQNDAFFWNDIAIGGTRLWDSLEYSFGQFVDYRENARANTAIKETSESEQEKIFQRELIRLETSLKMLDTKATSGQRRIAMTHYPPIGADLLPSRAAALLEKYKMEICVFGHLHNLKPNSTPFGIRNGVHYILTACDAIDFTPVKLIQ
ncbi:MAG: metallophosphoesterase [Parachlamydiaceae bacterium]|nr:metallophosphoesterase [Parachlamydiaceae bacterium]